MQKWTTPHITKIYEAFWVLADNRIEIIKDEVYFIEAKIYSSSKNKFYKVGFDKNKSIISNDNWSFYVWYLGYTSIALLIYLDFIKKEKDIIKYFKNIKWKDINVKNDNDFDKTVSEINNSVVSLWLDLQQLNCYCNYIFKKIKDLDLNFLWEKFLPPEWY